MPPQALGLEAHPELRPGEVEPCQDGVALLHLVLAHGHGEAFAAQETVEQRLEHALRRRRPGVPQGEDLPRHPGPSPAAAAEGVEAVDEAVEQLGVTPEGGLQGRLDEGWILHDGAQVHQCPRDAGYPQRAEQAGVGAAELPGVMLHDARLEPVELPEGSGSAMRDGGALPGPELGRHEALLPGDRRPPHPVDAGMHSLPGSRLQPAVQRLDREPGLQDLLPAEDSPLPGCEAAEALLRIFFTR